VSRVQDESAGYQCERFEAPSRSKRWMSDELGVVSSGPMRYAAKNEGQYPGTDRQAR
jgi:hypothetical protein